MAQAPPAPWTGRFSCPSPIAGKAGVLVYYRAGLGISRVVSFSKRRLLHLNN
jgi:hypothetical protein